jgi:Rod binding domain-containing protein
MNLAPAATPQLAVGTGQPLPENLEGACRALEKVFVQLVFQKMREAMVPDGSGGADGFARTSAAGMMDAQWADLASQGEGLGLWRSLYRQLDPEAVKSAGATPDQWIRGTSPRARADLAAKGGVEGLGPRPGRPRPAASAAAAAAGYRQSAVPSDGAASAGAKDRYR